jgi:hypothetical protein
MQFKERLMDTKPDDFYPAIRYSVIANLLFENDIYSTPSRLTTNELGIYMLIRLYSPSDVETGGHVVISFVDDEIEMITWNYNHYGLKSMVLIAEALGQQITGENTIIRHSDKMNVQQRITLRFPK